MLELRQFRYFVAVAEELHFSRAARRLNIATTTLSQQIKTIEDRLGAELFSRNKKQPVTLTKLGASFLTQAKLALHQAEQAEQIGRQVARGDSGRIVLGYVTSIGLSGIIGEAIREFCRSRPGVEFSLHRAETFPQLRAIESGAVDVAFTREPAQYPAGLSGFRVAEFECVVALPVDHPLVERKTIAMRELAGERFIGAPVESEVAFLDNLVAAFPPKHRVRIAARAPDVLSLLLMVSAGIGIGICSTAMAGLSIPGVVFRRVNRGLRRANHAFVYRQQANSAAAQSFRDFVLKRLAPDLLSRQFLIRHDCIERTLKNAGSRLADMRVVRAPRREAR